MSEAGRQEFSRKVAGLLSANDDHSCVDQTRPDYKGMARELWAMGYRFDPEARKQWLVSHLKANMPADLQDAFAELLELGEDKA